MNKKNVLIAVIAFLLTANSLLGQIPKNIFNEVSGESFNAKDFTVSTKSAKENAGAYHFGESESEWDLVFLPYKDSIIIQIWDGAWAESLGLKQQAWIRKCQTFNQVRFEGNKFYFGKYSGLFVEHKEGKTKTKSVLLFSDPINGSNYKKDSAEVGFYSTTINTFYDDKERYQLSLKILPETYFANKPKKELAILRNTVFANYGLIFQAGGEMDAYFRKKAWYQPFRNDVSACLTEIERQNIQVLKKFEQQ